MSRAKRKAASEPAAEPAPAVSSTAAAASKRAKRTFPTATQLADWKSGPNKGDLLAFGSGDMSQLGLGDDENMRERKKPTLLKHTADKDIVRIAVGSLHNAVLTRDGTVLSWGCNDDSALGHDEDEWFPTPVEAPLNDGTVKIVQITAGASHTLALSEDGKVYSWGTYRDANGIMGFSSTVEIAKKPYLMDALAGKKVIKIASGEQHDLALTDAGEVYQWGDIGFGNRSSARNKKIKLVPSRVLFKKQASVKAPHVVNVFAGGYSSFALDEDGTVWTWGPNNYSQTGIQGSDKSLVVQIPTPVPNLPPIARVAAAQHHTLFLTKTGQVFSVGRGEDGRLGHGDGKNHEVPTQIASLSGEIIIHVAAGEAHSLIINDKGELLTFGYGDLLQLGNGVEEDVLAPYKVESKELAEGGKGKGRFVLEAGGGSQHSLILTAAKN